jgi:surface antigen
MIKKHFYPRSGMAPNCGEFNYWMKIGGHDVQRKGVSCQKPDGTWEIVNTAY